MTPRCQRCGITLDPLARGVAVCAECQRRPRDPLGAVRSACAYAGPVERAIKQFKYQGKWRAEFALGELLGRWLATDVELPQGLGLTQAEGLVPVPLHRWRHWSRGFNQAERLARTLAQLSGLPVRPVLCRIRPTRQQVGLGPDDRRRNVAGAFALATRAEVAGQRLVLVDDVYTTGATLRECALTLRRGGAAEVTALTVARRVGQDELTPDI